MKIEILGTGCPNCAKMTKNAQDAVAKSGKFAQVEKVEDINKILSYNVISMPALVIDSKVKSSGKVLSVEEILSFIA